MNNKNTKSNMITIKRVWPDAHYSSSLIQQNHGENADGHGYFEWTLDKKKGHSYTFNSVYNDYGYHTLPVMNGSVPLSPNVSKKPRIRLLVKNTNAIELRRVIADVKRFYEDVQEVTINRVESSKSIGNSNSQMLSESAFDNVDLKNKPSKQATLIHEYLEDKYGIDDKELVTSVTRSLHENIESEKEPLSWTVKQFEFENMFSYGENNVIDINSMRGVIGIFADNASGKSSIFDALAFCLFGKCSRTRKASSILNNNENEFWCKATLEIGEYEYVIEKRAERGYQNRVPVDVDFYRINDNGTKTSLNGKQRRDTRKNIEKYIGSYEDFETTAMSTQSGAEIFINETQAGRKDLLSRFIGIDVFDDLHSHAKNYIRDIKSDLRALKKRDLSSELVDLEDEIDELTKSIDTKSSRLSKVKSKISKNQNRVIQLNKQIHDIDVNKDVNINSLESKKEDTESEINHIKARKNKLTSELEAKKSPHDSVVSRIDSEFDEDKLNNDYNEFKQNKKELKDISSKIDRILSKLENVNDNIVHVNDHREFDPDCEYCVARNEKDAKKLEEYQSQKQKLEDKLGQLNDQKDSLSSWISSHESIVEKHKRFQNIKKQLSSIKNEISDLTAKISKLDVKLERKRSSLESVSRKIDQYYTHKDALKENREIEEKIDKVEQRIQPLKSKKQDLESSISNKKQRRSVALHKKDDVTELMSKHEDQMQEYDFYKKYLEATKRDGVPYQIIRQIMPSVEEEVNAILSSIVDFHVEVEFDESNVEIYIVHGNKKKWNLEMASNFERFISGMALRIAIMNIANISKPDFLLIDEGFSVADSSNMTNMNVLFDYLKTQFRFAVIISHVAFMRDMVDDIIEIDNISDKSQVRYI